jgi:hypothetical protein
MKRYFITIVLLLVLVGDLVLAIGPWQAVRADDATPTDTPANYGPNLLIDGNMELWTDKNTLTNWFASGSTDIAQETVNKYNGSYSAKLFNATASPYILQILPNLQSGKTYMISIWVSNDSGGAYLTISNPDWTVAFTRSFDFGSSYYQILYTANGDEKFFLITGLPNHIVYFDAASIQEVIETPTNTPTPSDTPTYAPTDTQVFSPTLSLTPTFSTSPTSTPISSETPSPTPGFEILQSMTYGDMFIIQAVVITSIILIALALVMILLTIIYNRRGHKNE